MMSIIMVFGSLHSVITMMIITYHQSKAVAVCCITWEACLHGQVVSKRIYHCDLCSVFETLLSDDIFHDTLFILLQNVSLLNFLSNH